MKNTNIKKAIFSFKKLKPETYENLDLDRLVIYVLFILDKKKIPLYFDYITVALFRLFPRKFSMATFKKYPDTNRINKALRRLNDPKRKNWAKGSIENGFSITGIGKEVAIQTSELLKKPNKQKRRPQIVLTRSRGRSLEDDIRDIENSELFQKWFRKERKISDYEVLSFLSAVPYTPKELLLKYLEQIKKSSFTIENKKVSKFLNWLEKRFYHLFH